MKKLIALLLALLMAFSTVIAVSAEGTGEGTPAAPKNIQAQTRANKDENENIVSYDVRFLATVHSTVGKEIGFEVVATFLDKNGDTLETKEVTYSKKVNEVLDANMAGTTVYTTVTAAGKEYTAADLAKNDNTAIGVFAAVIEGVPAGLDVVFKINTYVDYEGGTNKSSVVTAQYANGAILDMTDSFGYSQDFSTASTNTQLLTAAGISKPFGQAMVPTLAGNRLNIPKTGWGSKDCFIELVGNQKFAAETGKYNYMYEMDVDFTDLSVFTLIFNGDADTVYNAKNSLFVSLRLGSGCDSLTKGLISEKSKNDTNNLWLRHGGFNASNGTVKTFGTATANQKNGYEDALAYNIADGASHAALKLSVVVNNTYENGCQVEVFVDGVSVYSFVAPEAYDVSSASKILLWAQDTVVSIDNIKVSKINGAITLGTKPADVTEMYSQDFNANNTNLTNVNVAHPYVNETCTTCGLPMIINDAGQLQIDKHAWHKNPDYYAHLISSDKVKAADIYKLEADINITSLSGFGFTINNDVDAANGNDKTYLENMLYVSFRVINSNLVFRIAHYNTSGGQAGSTDILIAEGTSKLNAKFTMIVDSTDSEGCRLYLYLDNELIGTVVYDDTYDVKANSSIGIWAQDTIATVDNIKFTGVKKNN